jgi:hypothetical protein
MSKKPSNNNHLYHAKIQSLLRKHDRVFGEIPLERSPGRGFEYTGVWAMVSNPWASFPKEIQVRLVPPKLSTKQGPAKTMNTPSKDLNSNVS